MNNKYKILLLMTTILIGYGSITHAQLDIPGHPTIYSDSQDQYIQANNINNPIRDGAYAAIKNPDSANSAIKGVQGGDQKIETYAAAKSQTLRLVYNIINYALGGLSAVALIYLMYHGFIILTALGDDAKYKEGMKGIKYAAIALMGIGFSWIFISTIFWVVNSFTKGTLPS